MQGEIKNGMQCAEFEALLAEALDGALQGDTLARFQQHRDSCGVCGATYAEVSNGLNWLRELEEVEPPRQLVHNIVAATSGRAHTAEEAAGSPARRPWLHGQLAAIFGPMLTPRFGMSAAMAFFSLSLLMGITGVRLADLTPHSLEHRFYTSQAKVVKYYENMRLVYELQTRYRDLQRMTGASQENEEGRPVPHSQQNKNDSEPGRREYQNYTQEKNDVKQAVLPEFLPLMATDARQRRIV